MSHKNKARDRNEITQHCFGLFANFTGCVLFFSFIFLQSTFTKHPPIHELNFDQSSSFFINAGGILLSVLLFFSFDPLL